MNPPRSLLARVEYVREHAHLSWSRVSAEVGFSDRLLRLVRSGRQPMSQQLRLALVAWLARRPLTMTQLAFSIPDALIPAVDRAARQDDRSRSSWLRRAVERALVAEGAATEADLDRARAAERS